MDTPLLIRMSDRPFLPRQARCTPATLAHAKQFSSCHLQLHLRSQRQPSPETLTTARASSTASHTTLHSQPPTTTTPDKLQETFLQSQSRLGAAQRGSRDRSEGPDPSPGPPDQQPDGGPNPGPGGPGGGGLSFRLRYWILLLVEYGGVYGTAAVLIAALTHVDAFGGLHWDTSDVALGLALMAPALAWDAVVGLPDWSTRQEDAEALVRLFVDPELLKPQQAGKGQQQQQPSTSASDVAADASTTDAAATTMAAAATTSSSSSSSSSSEGEVVAAATAAAATSASPRAAGGNGSQGEVPAAEASTSGGNRGTEGAGGGGASSSGSNKGRPQPSGALWATAQRLRMAMELMQESSIRNNPGARLTPVQEAAVIGVAVTADEMLYRAVLLTLFGRWLRDRFYEAGAEEVFTLALPGGPHGVEVDTAAAAQWVALGVGVAAGAAVFAAKAWQEATMARRLEALSKMEAEAAAKALMKQRLSGQHISEEQLREEKAKQAKVQAARAMLVSSIGMQGALVWVLEGLREVYQVTAAGAAFILTGNLAAPIAGGLAAQVLVSTYQRLGLRRNMQRRAEVVARRRERRLAEAAQAAAGSTAADTEADAAAVQEAVPGRTAERDATVAPGTGEGAGREGAPQPPQPQPPQNAQEDRQE